MSTANTLSLIRSDALRVRDAELARLQQSAIDNVNRIRLTDQENALRSLFVGVALLRIKESLAYGQFGPWVEANFKCSRRMIGYYMSAAMVFIGEMKLASAELAINPGDKFELAVDSRDAAVKRFVSKARKFIGDSSFSELLAEHGIKETAALGGARTKGKGGKGAQPDAEQLYLFARDEIGEVIERAETLLIKENRLQYLVAHPEEVRGVIYALNTLAEKVESAAKDFLKTEPAAKKKG